MLDHLTLDLFVSLSAGINALWGPLHGGANQAVIEMLEAIKEDGGDTKKYMAKAKDKTDPFRLMGFGHRVYKNFDPRAKIIKVAADEVLEALGVEDPILDIAKGLEKEALEDPYFVIESYILMLIFIQVLYIAPWEYLQKCLHQCLH